MIYEGLVNDIINTSAHSSASVNPSHEPNHMSYYTEAMAGALQTV